MGDIVEVPGNIKMAMFADPDGNKLQLISAFEYVKNNVTIVIRWWNGKIFSLSSSTILIETDYDLFLRQNKQRNETHTKRSDQYDSFAKYKAADTDFRGFSF